MIHALLITKIRPKYQREQDVVWLALVLTPVPQESWEMKTLSTNESDSVSIPSVGVKLSVNVLIIQTYRTFSRMLWSRWKWDRSIRSLRSVSGRRLYSSMNLKGMCLWDFMVKLIDPTCVAFDVLTEFRFPSKRFAHRRVIVAAVLTIDIWAHWDLVRKLSLLKWWKQHPSWL